jgi:hypothetical protein
LIAHARSGNQKDCEADVARALSKLDANAEHDVQKL